jgi:hypothetical protein
MLGQARKSARQKSIWHAQVLGQNHYLRNAVQGFVAGGVVVGGVVAGGVFAGGLVAGGVVAGGVVVVGAVVVVSLTVLSGPTVVCRIPNIMASSTSTTIAPSNNGLLRLPMPNREPGSSGGKAIVSSCCSMAAGWERT